MNKAILMGRLTRDPEMRQTPNGVTVARFSVAVNRRFAKEGQQDADFINCVAWRQTAEFISRYFHKGSMIAVVGSIQSRSWDGADGKKQYATEVSVDEAYFTGSKSETGTGENAAYNGGARSGAYQAPQARPAAPSSQPTEGFDDFDPMGFSVSDGSEDDLPF